MKTTTPLSQEANQLLLEGQHAFSQTQSYGCKVDVPYYEKQEKHLERRIKKLKEQFNETELAELWVKNIKKPNFQSKPQLSHILYNVMGYTPLEWTDHPTDPKPKVTENACKSLDNPDLELFFKIAKLIDVKNTFVRNILNEQVNGFLHSFYKLYSVRSFRSSSSNINEQNNPKRDKELCRIIRRGRVPRKGRQLLELDFKGAEIATSACYHQDVNFLNYLEDDSKDMHWDSIRDIYLLSDDDYDKTTRYSGKNGFTFPQFYGSWWKDCAPNLWKNVEELGLTTKDGVDIYKHLETKGIHKLGKFIEEEKDDGKIFYKPEPNTFLEHVAVFEQYFWNEMFPEYNQWKQNWWKQYLERGFIDLLSGFRIAGVMRKNAVTNYAIQGSSFHILLWSFIQLNRILLEKFESRLIGQIHDSMIIDLVPEEKDEILAIAKDIATVKVKKHWNWIVAPLVIEAEISDVDGNWNEMEEIEI